MTAETINLAILQLVMNKVIEQLECPVCLESCTTPIYMCTNGHNICSSCKPKVQECPSCRAPGSPTLRNISMEAICSVMLLPCKFKDAGCEVQVHSKNLEAHYAVCEYRYKCLITSCEWFGSVRNIVEHVKESHPLNQAGTNDLQVISTLWNLTENMWTQVLMSKFHTALFWFNYRYSIEESKFYFYSQFIGPQDDAVKYVFEFTLFTPDGSISNAFSAPPLTLDEDYKISPKTFVLCKEQADRFFSKDGYVKYKRCMRFK